MYVLMILFGLVGLGMSRDICCDMGLCLVCVVNLQTVVLQWLKIVGVYWCQFWVWLLSCLALFVIELSTVLVRANFVMVLGLWLLRWLYGVLLIH